MKAKHVAPFVLPLAVLFCVPAQARIVFEDTFDTYATAGEFTQTWTPEGSPVYDLDTSFGVTGGSVRMPAPRNGTGTTDRYYRNLGQKVNGTDAKPWSSRSTST